MKKKTKRRNKTNTPVDDPTEVRLLRCESHAAVCVVMAGVVRVLDLRCDYMFASCQGVVMG